MRNYDKEIDELHERIAVLELERTTSERQRNKIPAKRKKEKKRPVVKDEDGTIIHIGDWVKATTPGKFIHNEGTVEGWKKWVTFVDESGVKQVRAPHNLLVSNDVRKSTRANSASGKR